MDVELVNNLITSGVTLAVGAGGAVVAYYGTVKGAKMQIESEKKKLDQAKEQQAKFTRKAIENFLSNEIKFNFIKLNTSHLSVKIEDNELPFQYSVTHTYNYYEFNSLKYELIKRESNEVKEIINIYNMFYLIERKQEIMDFTQLEYENFKEAYNVCLSKYNDI
jgi:hypothetical protein